jgi:hypothetical protein
MKFMSFVLESLTNHILKLINVIMVGDIKLKIAPSLDVLSKPPDCWSLAYTGGLSVNLTQVKRTLKFTINWDIELSRLVIDWLYH